jgi:hypothetical protein
MSDEELISNHGAWSGVYIPLQGAQGERPKAPKVAGWQSPSYEGVSVWLPDAWVGLRCDGLVVIDCDSSESADAWIKRTGTTDGETWLRKTPRGFHFLYRWTPGSPDGPKVGVLDATDVRAGRTSQIVFHAPGYSDQTSPEALSDFDPTWLPPRPSSALGDVEEWTEMPDGRGNNTMTALAGAMRRQGMSGDVIYASLKGINKLTMTRNPMPDDMLRQIATSVGRYTPDPDIEILAEDDDVEGVEDDDERPKRRSVLVRSDEVEEAPPTQWFWKPYFPAGHLVMLDGEEGIGKGLFAIWLTMQCLTGKWSDRPGVLWLTTEDTHQELAQRMRAAGYEAEKHPHALFWDLERHWPNFQHDLGLLKQAIERNDISAVFLDPGRSFLGVSDFNDEAKIRPAMERLRLIAASTGALIVFIHHHNKMDSNSTTLRMRVGGSGAFRQVVRHQVTMSVVGADRAFAVGKSNLADAAGTVRLYRIRKHQALDSAFFELGDAVPGVINMDVFNQQERNAHVELDATDEVRDALRKWPTESLPGAKRLFGTLKGTDVCVTLNHVTDAYKTLVGNGELLDLGNGYRWPDDPKAGGERA